MDLAGASKAPVPFLAARLHGSPSRGPLTSPWRPSGPLATLFGCKLVVHPCSHQSYVRGTVTGQKGLEPEPGTFCGFGVNHHEIRSWPLDYLGQEEGRGLATLGPFQEGEEVASL